MSQRLMDRFRSEEGRKDLRRIIASRWLNPVMRRMGYTVIADHFYQPLPNDDEINLYRNTPRPLSSITWCLEQQLSTARDLLTENRAEYNKPDVIGATGYPIDCTRFGVGDAQILYSLIRSRKPNRIIEIGSGYSTLVMTAALQLNYLETAKTGELISIEPYPEGFLRNVISQSNKYIDHQLIDRSLQTCDISIFDDLGPNDILFVDSSHVFKQGSDVEYEFLQIYPRIKRDVAVHIHDIFFPFDYPVDWNLKRFQFWNEQYFLETFLQFNDKFRVLMSLAMIAHYNKSIFADNITAYREPFRPGSFWMTAIR